VATDIGVVRGLIELQDNFTGQLGLAEAALGQFTKQNQESLIAVAGAVGLVTAAFGLAATAVYNLGQRGADVKDVESTLEHFSGTAAAAAANLDALRNGTQGTVEDFLLMKDASKLLSAGVKLNTEDFSTLGEAAFVLQNRGLGGTKEMLNLVSDAMVTGRTRALSMALGVIDVGDAEEKYAQQLGITKDHLSDTGKVEAKRLAIMGMLRTAVADAGTQERDFGEQIEFAQAAMTNWIDELGKAIATSPALAAGMKAIESALKAAFGGDSQEAIATTMEAIKSGALITVSFGIAAVETARVIHRAWEAIRTIVLGVETVLVAVATAITGAISMIVIAAGNLPGASEGMKEMARQAKETVVFLAEMTKSLASQTAEAGAAVAGYSEFDKTLDKLGGTMFEVRDAIQGAEAIQQQSNETTDIASSNAQKLAASNSELTSRLIDRAKIEEELWKIEKKSLEETIILWNEYFRLRAASAGTTVDSAKAAIQAWFDDEVAKLDASDRNWQNHYDALAAVAGEKLKAVEMDWDSVRDKSIESLQQQADAAKRTYDEMIFGSLHFTREVLEEQRKKMEQAADAARNFSSAVSGAFDEAGSAGAAGVEVFNSIRDAVDAVNAGLNETNVRVRTLSGEFETLAEAKARYESGGSTNVTKATLLMTGDKWFSQMGTTRAALFELLDMGFSLENAFWVLKAGMNPNDWKGDKGPRVPGFAEGGVVMVGERGPEAVRLPFGSQVFPTGATPGGGGVVNIEIYVNGTAADVAKKVSAEIMRTLKQHRQFGAA
jgi:hypothetical protein